VFFCKKQKVKKQYSPRPNRGVLSLSDASLKNMYRKSYKKQKKRRKKKRESAKHG
jgi:hypothetical protein